MSSRGVGGGAEDKEERGGRNFKQTPCREPNVGLDPRTLGSCPGPKAGAKLLSHPGFPLNEFSKCVHLCSHRVDQDRILSWPQRILFCPLPDSTSPC